MRRNWLRYPTLTVFLLLVLCFVAVVVPITLRNTSIRLERDGPQQSGEVAPDSPWQSTLSIVQTRGSLVCGVVENPGFSMFNNTTGEWSGFEVDLVSFEV
jgi:ABC-type amino acid transport substrate-binding protein